MQLISLILVLSTVSLTSAQSGVIGLQPHEPKLLSDLNQYVPQKRIKFKWEIKTPSKGACDCAEPICPDLLNQASVSCPSETRVVLC
jgi:hypothetical protein